MKAYGASIAKFEGADTQVFGVSTDNSPSQKVFAEQTNATFPMLSDFRDRNVSKAYGILMPSGVANRATFVVDKAGKIQFIEEGKAAVDITGAATACSRLAGKHQRPPGPPPLRRGPLTRKSPASAEPQSSPPPARSS